MRLQLPSSLHYPITVTELLKQPNDHVDRSEALFAYYYSTTVTEGNRFGEEHEVVKTFPSRYESPVEGVLRAWAIEEGTVIAADHVGVADIEEPCSHSVQFGGMCTICGKDMTEVSYNTDISNADRATISMTHDNNALTVSQDEATRVEEAAKRRLLQSKKLSLVVDLDQTIIHATVDPTVAEWQRDQDNPNHGAVKDVQAFQLATDGPGVRGCWYYIKLRPGLAAFLENVSKLYELHIYTMGTRAYARHIANIVDPERKIFGDRILSRDESGSLTAKNLQRLFPVDTKMVVIIDDRGDVWKWSDNLIKVTPYDFFVGIGDINSSFLPKKAELQSTPSPAVLPAPQVEAPLVEADTNPHEQTSGAADDDVLPAGADLPTKHDVSALDQLVSMGGGDDPTVLRQQATKQDETLTAQLQDRPLLQQQRRLDAADSAAAAMAEDMVADADPPSAPPRHHLLRDSDTELRYLEQNLREVHRAFFEEYDHKLDKAPTNRIAELRGDRSVRKVPVQEGSADLDAVPDVKCILPLMKLRVLEGVVLVLSGVVPLGTDIQRSDIALWATSFGARVALHVNKHTTHVVAARNRTAKVRQAARIQRIKIVATQWLLDSISQWQRLPEDDFLIPLHPDDREGGRGKHAMDVDVDLDLTDDDEDILLSSENDMPDHLDEDGENTNADTDDPDGVMPAELDENHSPVDGFEGYNWKEVEDDLADFLGSDGEDSEGESGASDSSQPGGVVMKRKRSQSSQLSATDDASRASEGGPQENGSPLAKRQQVARARTTTLKAVESSALNGSSLPSPDTTAEERADAEAEAEAELAAEEEELAEMGLDDFDLEQELAAEIERELSADVDEA
ncbi:MAG: Carboxy-terminal domain (CTD) phosphatase [Thelocarpon superellum]|nr:MAG: Carboxy-terminal domain (CTD) phosphatase [Thelocarpon superellum]